MIAREEVTRLLEGPAVADPPAGQQAGGFAGEPRQASPAGAVTVPPWQDGAEASALPRAYQDLLEVAADAGLAMAGLVHRQGGSHASRPGADDGNASAPGRDSIHAGSSGRHSVALGAASGRERNTSLTQSATYTLTYGRWSSPMCSAPPSAAVKIRSSRRGLAVAWS